MHSKASFSLPPTSEASVSTPGIEFSYADVCGCESLFNIDDEFVIKGRVLHMFLDKEVMVASAALKERLSGDDSEDCTTLVSLMLYLIDRKENGDLGAADELAIRALGDPQNRDVAVREYLALEWFGETAVMLQER
jgi:hypothetical protein